VEKMQIEKIAIDKLLLDPANARKHGQKNLDSIKGSLAKFGQQKPIVVNADNVIVAGNGTMQAAKELGWKEINIVRTDLKGSDITAFGIADNRTSELAEWDDKVLQEVLESLKAEDFDLSVIGFDDEDLGRYSIDGIGMPKLPDGEKAPFQQKTFTLHDSQAESIDCAVELAKAQGGDKSDLNENTNGNAIAFICDFFIRENS
jgi:ParB family transcriptional regulator, chromosome partitioning protein